MCCTQQLHHAPPRLHLLRFLPSRHRRRSRCRLPQPLCHLHGDSSSYPTAHCRTAPRIRPLAARRQALRRSHLNTSPAPLPGGLKEVFLSNDTMNYQHEIVKHLNNTHASSEECVVNVAFLYNAWALSNELSSNELMACGYAIVSKLRSMPGSSGRNSAFDLLSACAREGHPCVEVHNGCRRLKAIDPGNTVSYRGGVINRTSGRGRKIGAHCGRR